MHYIVFDLEWNNLFYEPKNSLNKSDVKFDKSGFDEIIEIGAYKLNRKFEVVDKFDRQVKPVVYKKMANVVRRMTGICYQQLVDKDSYQEVIADFLEFIGKDYTFVTFSDTDIRVLFINNLFFGIDNKLFNYSKFIDVQEVFTKKMSLNVNPSLSRVGEMMDFEVCINNMHTALDDAELTVRVFRELSNSIRMSKVTKNAYKHVHLPKFFEVDLLKVDKKLLKARCLRCGRRKVRQQRNYNTGKNKIVIKSYCEKCCLLSIKSITVKKSISGENDYFIKESSLDRNKDIW